MVGILSVKGINIVTKFESLYGLKKSCLQVVYDSPWQILYNEELCPCKFTRSVMGLGDCNLKGVVGQGFYFTVGIWCLCLKVRV